MFQCETCGRIYKKFKFYQKHLRDQACTPDGRFKCVECKLIFKKLSTMREHRRTTHNYTRTYPCSRCHKIFQSAQTLQNHLQTHKTDELFHAVKTSFKGAFCHYRLDFPNPLRSLEEMKNQYEDRIVLKLQDLLADLGYYKVNFVVMTKMTKFVDENNEENTINTPFRTNSQLIYPQDSLQDHFHNALVQVGQTIDEFTENGSGYILQGIYSITLEVGKCRPLAGSCSLHVVKRQLVRQPSSESKESKEFISIQDQEECYSEHDCFFIALAKHFQKFGPFKNFSIETLVSIIDRGDVRSPVDIRDIDKLESLNANRLDFGVNVIFQASSDAYLPLYATRRLKAEYTVNLLLFHVIKDEQKTLHYALIEDIEDLFPIIYRDKKRRKGVLCMNCFHHYTSQLGLYFERL